MAAPLPRALLVLTLVAGCGRPPDLGLAMDSGERDRPPPALVPLGPLIAAAGAPGAAGAEGAAAAADLAARAAALRARAALLRGPVLSEAERAALSRNVAERAGSR
jgi:predicted glycosyltransferase